MRTFQVKESIQLFRINAVREGNWQHFRPAGAAGVPESNEPRISIKLGLWRALKPSFEGKGLLIFEDLLYTLIGWWVRGQTLYIHEQNKGKVSIRSSDSRFAASDGSEVSAESEVSAFVVRNRCLSIWRQNCQGTGTSNGLTGDRSRQIVNSL